MRYRYVFAALVAIVAATCAVAPPSGTTHSSRGAELFAHHCAVCHGATGDADTAVAELLLPQPNPFRKGLFKLVSTDNGIPTEDDLVRTLYFGLPGSTMMAWSWMPNEDLVALAREVRRLAIAGRADSIHNTAAITGRPIAFAEAMQQAEREMTPGEVVDTGAMAPASDDTLAEGRQLYLRHCASCHGSDGRGLPGAQDWPAAGNRLWPRDFTSGYLRSDASHRELAYRIRAGMPAAFMPPAPISVAETEALVAYIRSLLPDGAGDRHAQWRRTVRVPKVEELSATAKLDTVRLPVVPLQWRPEACDDVRLRAAHDGQEIMIEVSWADGTRDDRVRPDAKMSDGIALQFAFDDDPPLFAMGTTSQPVNVWRWHAYDPKELAGIVDLVGAQPHQNLGIPVSIQLEPQSESVQFGGMRSVGRATGSGLPLDAETSWENGRWRATFRRALAARSEEEVDLTGSGPLLFAVAVWDGAIDRHPGSKAITTWHVLELEK